MAEKIIDGQNHNFKEEGQFQRKMTSRHLFMLSLGGVIGTGLFLSSGYTIAQAGPLGAILSYLVGAVVVYLVMLSLGELAVAMPVTGSFHTYATKFISPGTGFTVAWLYWLCWTVALGTEFLGAGLLMGRWFPSVPTWVFATIFAGIIFALNALSVQFFAEAEFYFSSIKVITIVLFIIFGLGAMFGLIPMTDGNAAPFFSNLTAHGAFPSGIIAVVSVMLAVNYAFSGTELIGIAAGETENPQEAVPKAIKTTIGRLVIFFVLTIVVLASLLPLEEAGVSQAPFVTVFDKIGIPFAADLMNFVILTAILSAGNSGLYASSRMLWSLANEGMISKKVVKINQHGVPMRALLLSMVGALLALLSSIYAADTVFLALVSIAGFAVVVVWLSIPLAQINFRKEWKKEHSEEELTYKTPFNPILPYITIALLAISILGIAWDESQRAGLYFGIPFIALCYLYYGIREKLQGSTSENLKSLLESKDVLILDGALGTELESQGHDVSGNLWSAKYLLDQPEIIQDIHEQYVLAGSDVITSASYQASFPGLIEAGLSEEEASQIIASTVTIAKQAIKEAWAKLPKEERNKRIYPLVGGSIGPYAAYLADGSEYTGIYQVVESDLETFQEKRIQALVDMGADLLAIETIPNYLEATVLVRLLSKYPQISAYISFTSQDGRTISDGTPIEKVVALCEEVPNILAIGLNCTAPQHIEGLLKKMRQVSRKPFIVYPNSGEIYDGQNKTWHNNPEDEQTLADYSQVWKPYGVKMIGGCCRTRPADIADLRKGLGY